MTDLQTMETSLYDDHCYSSAMSGESSQNSPAESSGALKRPAAISLSSNSDSRNIKELKKNLTLDFTSPESAKKTLGTPDIVRFLQLASPELEKFLTQGVVQVTTPTPTTFLFPKNVTADQEQYARGFIDALNHLHQLNNFSPGANLLSPGFAASLAGTAAAAAAVSSAAASSKASISSSSAQDSPLTSTSNSVQKVPVQSPSKPGTSVASVIMGTVGFQPGTAVMSMNHHHQAFQAALQGLSAAPMGIPAAMALFAAPASKALNQQTATLTEDRPPSQSAEPGAMEFTNLTMAQPAASSSVPPVATSAQNSFQHLLTQPAQYLDVSTTATPAHRTVRGGQTVHVKTEPDQAVPNVNFQADGAFALAPSTSSRPDSNPFVDMKEQERMKLDRKRHRNRIAASKCRKRKLDRIATLEAELKEHEAKRKLLTDEADSLKEEIAKFRAELTAHRASGCGINSRIVNGAVRK